MSSTSDTCTLSMDLQHPFAVMDRIEFLGRPRITRASNAAELIPKAIKSLDGVATEPFIHGLAAKYCPNGCTVFDGDRVIACYDFGDTLVVDKKYRRRGIALELVYQWRTRYPAPAMAKDRTRASQAVQERVWERIQSDLLKLRAAMRQSNTVAHQDVLPTQAPWCVWDDGLDENAAERILASRQRNHAAGYQFRIIPSPFHGEGHFAVEGQKLVPHSQPNNALDLPDLINGEDGKPALFYHGALGDFESLDTSETVDGGLHFGTAEQAQMRIAGATSGRIIAAYLTAKKLRRCQDEGGNWEFKIAAAKRARCDAIIYLNRWEGMTTDVVERLSAQGLLGNLDEMTDAEFKQLVPEARESVIVFKSEQVHVESVSQSNEEVGRRRPSPKN